MKDKLKKFNYINTNSHGFTLIELLVVIVIIGIIASISTVYYVGAQKKARDNRRKSDFEQIRSGLEMYYVDEDQYPEDADFTFGSSLTGTKGTYIKEIPQDPKNPTYNYLYHRIDADNYCLCGYLEDSNPGTSCDCGAGTCGDASCNYSMENP